VGQVVPVGPYLDFKLKARYLEWQGKAKNTSSAKGVMQHLGYAARVVDLGTRLQTYKWYLDWQDPDERNRFTTFLVVLTKHGIEMKISTYCLGFPRLLNDGVKAFLDAWDRREQELQS
jgi:hypothetical protein